MKRDYDSELKELAEAAKRDGCLIKLEEISLCVDSARWPSVEVFVAHSATGEKNAAT